MKTFLLVLLLLALLGPLGVRAQGGGCSITLLSTPGSQTFCTATLPQVIEPVVFLVEGSGLQIADLPPGITATMSDDTLTLAGAITEWGDWETTITLAEGCWNGTGFHVSQSVDPQYACAVEGENVTVSWAGLNTPFMLGGTIYVAVYAGGYPDGELVDNLILFTPEENQWTISGLPQNVELTFHVFVSGGYPTCSFENALLTCTIVSTGVQDGAIDLPIRAVLLDDRLQLSSAHRMNEIRVLDPVGRVISFYPSNATVVDISIAGLSSGVFLVQVLDADGRSSLQRFVKP